MFSADTIAKFWARVSRGGEDDCWEWTRFRNRQGYGRVSLGGKLYLAHRASWLITHGSLEDGICILHRCDNPPCCNPAHLFDGDRAANNADTYAKGKGLFTRLNAKRAGSRNPQAKLTEDEVAAIIASTLTQQAIADIYGISQTTVSRIKLRKNWMHI